MPVSKYLIGFLMGLTLFSMFSCKTKYLELQEKYERSKQRKAALEQENVRLVKDIAILSDSLSVLVPDYYNYKKYQEQISEIERLKKDFLYKKVPYYLELKKRQKEKSKSGKP